MDEAEPVSLRVKAEQDLGDGQADQFGVREAGRTSSLPQAAQADEMVVDGDVQCANEDVELGLHNPVFGVLALLVTACFLVPAGSEPTI